MKILNWIVVLSAAPIGFILALIVAWILELVSVGQWFIGLLLLLVFAGLFVMDALMDKVIDPIFDRLFRSGPQIEENPEIEKEQTLKSRYAFVAGIALGLIASWIWSAGQIVRLF